MKLNEELKMQLSTCKEDLICYPKVCMCVFIKNENTSND